MPSGILNPKSINLIGHGVVAYLPGLFEEIEKLEAAGVNTSGRILLSDRAHVLLDMHREVRESTQPPCHRGGTHAGGGVSGGRRVTMLLHRCVVHKLHGTRMVHRTYA